MRIISLYFVAIVLFCNDSSAQQREMCVVDLDLPGLPGGLSAALVRRDEGNGADTVQVVKTEPGRIVFKKELIVDGQIYFIRIKDTSKLYISKGKSNWTSFLLDGTSIHLSGNQSEWPDVKVVGSPATIVYHSYHNKLTQLQKELRDLEKHLKNSDSSTLKAKQEEYKKFCREYFLEHRSSAATALLILNSRVLTMDEKQVAFETLDDDIKESYYGKAVKKELDYGRLASNLAVGKPIPDFSVESPNGQSFSINEIVGKSEYTLIDFWASWCKPCIEDIPFMKRTFSDFKDKGFNIISISIDGRKADWNRALRKENTKWINGIDSEKISNILFPLDAIPAYILVNEKMEVVAVDISTFRKVENLERARYNLDGVSKGLRENDLYEVIKHLLEKRM